MREFTIYDMFQRNARVSGDETALVGDGQRLTFKELLNQTDSLAAGLKKQGIGKGDRIAILAHNHYKFFFLFGAAAALGAIVVPVNWRLSDEEIQYILKDSAPKILVADEHVEKAGDMALNVLPVGGIVCFQPSSGEPACIDALMDTGSAPHESVAGDDPFCIIYTAAMEGKPRGAVLSHNNIVFGNIQTIARMALTPQDAYLNMLPLFHITGLNLAMSVLHAGGRNVVIEKFDEKLTLELTEKERISVLGSFPPILSRLLSQMKKNDYDLSSLRIVLGIDGPDNIMPFEQKTNSDFWILYGQTETTGLVTFSPASERPGTAGRQGPLTKMKIVDETDQEVPIGETGEIAVQGPLVFKGYWNQEELNRKTFRNGWHHTGDLGRLDEEGYLWFAGRKPEKELIKPGGENVYPAEVEEVILKHPEVEAVSVIGVPDPEFGEGIKAVCVLKKGSALTAKELTEFVAARIARYKKPRYVTFADELPRKADGAIDREKVKQQFTAD